MKRLLLVSLIAGLLVLSHGAGRLAYGGNCGCGGAPAPASYAACDACDTCAPCGDCCRPCCDPIRGVLQLPLKAIEWVTHLGCCDNGCGERYWGECSERVDCCDPCDDCGNWVGHAGRSYAGPSVAGYARSAPRPMTYAQRPAQNYNNVNGEFGLDSSARVVSRTDQVVVPAQASRPMTAQANQQPHRAPSRR